MEAVAKFLTDIFNRLRGSSIINHTYEQETLRLEIKTHIAAYLKPPVQTINLVLEGCRHLQYLSYTQIQEARASQTDTSKIFNQNLVVQGIEKRPLSDYILYCISQTKAVEAGELHFSATGFQLYDQEFGRLSYPTFCEVADKSTYPL